MTGAEDILAVETRVLQAKGAEYATEADPLRAFRNVAAFTGVHLSDVALCYLLKHIQGISNTLAKGPIDPDDWCMRRPDGSEGLKQRFVDARNYLLLLADIIDEEVGE